MEFSKLSSNDKTAVVASAVVVVTGLISLVNGWGGVLIVALLGAAGMLAVVFMSQSSPSARLPGSKGSLMLIAGGAAAVFWVLATLTWIGWIFDHLADVDTLQFVIGLAASLVTGWTGWRAFQAEGGKLRLGSNQDQAG